MTGMRRLALVATAAAAAGILAYLVVTSAAFAGPKAPTTHEAEAEGKTEEDLAKEKADEERRARARRRRGLTSNSRRSSSASVDHGATIHCPRQSLSRSTPMVQVAVVLHGETLSSASHTRAFQNTC